jgi:hypothetical protein
MNSKTSRLRVFAALVVLAPLGACHRDSQQAPQAKAAPKVRAPDTAQRGPTQGEMTTGMVEAASQGKSQAEVSLKFDLLQRPMMGQPLEIAIALLPRMHASPATIAVTGGSGLQVAPGDDQIEIPSVEPTQVYRRSIKVTPTAEGVLFVSLNVSLKHDEVSDSRVFSVPIIVDADQPNAVKPAGAANPAKAPNTTQRE